MSPTIVETTSKQVLGLLAGMVAAMAGIAAIAGPAILGVARAEAQAAVAKQADIDRAQYVSKVELVAIMRELDHIRSQLDRIESRAGK